jgi:hypothetical protein
MPALRRSRPAPPRPPNRGGSLLRGGLLAVLLAVTAWVAVRHPVAPADAWPPPHRFQPDAEACREAREGRQWTFLVVPDAGGTVTVGEVARKHHLEVRWLCAANGLPEDCAATAVAPGDRLVLPLHAEAVAAARAALDGGGA